MLTQGFAPNLKCRLIISSLLKLPHLLDCLIGTRNAMSIVSLLHVMRSGTGGRRCEWGDRGWVSSDSFCFVFVLLFIFFFYGPFNYEILLQRNCCVCCVKLF